MKPFKHVLKISKANINIGLFWLIVIIKAVAKSLSRWQNLAGLKKVNMIDRRLL